MTDYGSLTKDKTFFLFFTVFSEKYLGNIEDNLEMPFEKLEFLSKIIPKCIPNKLTSPCGRTTELNNPPSTCFSVFIFFFLEN